MVNVSTVSQLRSAVANLPSGGTIMIAPGTYNLTGTLNLPQNRSNLAIRGATGNRDDVILERRWDLGRVRRWRHDRGPDD